VSRGGMIDRLLQSFALVPAADKHAHSPSLWPLSARNSEYGMPERQIRQLDR
jgi:hypothetical protein